jgi:hypothetical protein
MTASLLVSLGNGAQEALEESTIYICERPALVFVRDDHKAESRSVATTRCLESNL